MTTVGYGGKYPRTMSGKIVGLSAAIFGSMYLAMPLTIVGSKFYAIFQTVESQSLQARYKQEQEIFAEKRMSLLDSEDKLREANIPNLALKKVVTLKQWVWRAKQKLEVAVLTANEKEKIVTFIKDIRKYAHLHRFHREELLHVKSELQEIFCIISRHIVHRRSERLNMDERQMY